MKSVQLMIKIFINMLGNDEENVLCGIPGITHYCSPFGCAVHVVVLWASGPSSAGDRKVSLHSGCTDLLLLRGETESSVLIQFHAFQVGFGM